MPRKPANLDGQVFYNLTVLGIADQRNAHGRALYKCRCACGNIVLATAPNLRRGEVKSCTACKYLMQSKDITGQRFGRLVAIERAGKPTGTQTTYRWRCRCDCGKIVTVTLNSLTTGKTQSCGCLQKEAVKSLYIDGTAPAKLTESKRPRITNTSGVTGVWYDSHRDKWVAEIMLRGKKYFLGRYENKDEAIAVRKKAETELFEPLIQKYKKERGKKVNQPTHEIIRAARINAGLTQRELGLRLGYSEKTAQILMAMWESGTRPVPKAKIRSLCDILGLDPLIFIL
jgi:DNA-binding XRE family transcriptional regulator